MLKTKWYQPIATLCASLAMIGSISGCTTNQTSQQRMDSSPSKTVTNSTITAGFDFKKYLPFTPLLPSFTAGHQLTYSEIIRYLRISPNNNEISYSASYPVGFVITEGRTDQLHMAQLAPKTSITINNSIHATMQKHDGGESIDFIKNNIFYDVTSTQGTISLRDLKKVCASITIPATQPPNVIHLSDNGPKSVNELSFKPIMTGQFHVPSGFKLNTQGSTINISRTLKKETFQITYKSGSSYLTVIQSRGETLDYAKISSYHVVKMKGMSVYFQANNEGLPEVVFTIPKTGVQFTIWSNISSSELTNVVNSLLLM